MVTVVFYSVSTLCLLTSLIRQASWRAGGREGWTPLLPVLLCLAGAFAFLAPATQEVASSIVPSLGRLLSNCCTLVAAHAFSELLRYLHGRTEDPGSGPLSQRRRFLFLGSVLVLLVVTFFLGDRPQTGLGLFTYTDDLPLTIYAVIYAAYLSYALIQMLRLAVRAIRRTRRHLRVSMATIALGNAIGLAYSLSKIQHVTMSYLGLTTGNDKICAGPFSRIDCALSVGFPALSVLLILLGLAVPFLFKAPGRIVAWLAAARLLRMLHPLWRAMYQALPQIALTSPEAVTGRVPLHDVPVRLYRRTVEVRDGALLLQPYRSSADTSEHTRQAQRLGLVGDDARIAVEAADLTSAMKRYLHQAAPDTAAVHRAAPEEPDDVMQETRWLAQVSVAFAQQRIRPALIEREEAT
ncbi:MAB_1171c family putative transporter [Pseudonocardia sp. H11422]|uniref:MAB_1171c family putative transporter n=1 Tax=Pseudonocardia sp. H11422 TaxID=2835866 RepID=UPI001BDC39DA|nr:MAB_1171c family putative transporter [Pseudonocardia sp. H11422]